MIRFVGEYKAKLDDRGRLIFPSAFKSLVSEEPDKRFVVKKSLFSNCLEMYSFAEWEQRSEEVRGRLNFFNPDHARFWREFMRNTAEVEPDAKLGRILIPADLLSGIGVEKDVVFFGSNHMIEIWSKEAFDASRMPDDEYVNLARTILG